MSQSLSRVYVHLIFSTKKREPVMLQPFRKRVHAYLATVLNNEDCPAIKVGGMSEHVHILFCLSKNLTLSKIVERVKTSSSKWGQVAAVWNGRLSLAERLWRVFSEP
jgi:REP element-mobilizing transposase RayT